MARAGAEPRALLDHRAQADERDLAARLADRAPRPTSTPSSRIARSTVAPGAHDRAGQQDRRRAPPRPPRPRAPRPITLRSTRPGHASRRARSGSTRSSAPSSTPRRGAVATVACVRTGQAGSSRSIGGSSSTQLLVALPVRRRSCPRRASSRRSGARAPRPRRRGAAAARGRGPRARPRRPARRARRACRARGSGANTKTSLAIRLPSRLVRLVGVLAHLAALDLDDAVAPGVLGIDLGGHHRHGLAGLAVLLDQRAVVELVDGVGADDDERLGVELADQRRRCATARRRCPAGSPSGSSLPSRGCRTSRPPDGAVEVPRAPVREVVAERDRVELLRRPTRRRSRALRQLLSGKSISRCVPANGTAGFARLWSAAPAARRRRRRG